MWLPVSQNSVKGFCKGPRNGTEGGRHLPIYLGRGFIGTVPPPPETTEIVEVA